MNFKKILLWSIAGALFGVFFGGLASFFQGGPSAPQGIKESWIFFAVVGFIKACTDPKTTKENSSNKP